MAMMITRFNRLLSSKLVWLLFIGVVVVMFALSGIGQQGFNISDLWSTTGENRKAGTLAGEKITERDLEESRAMIRLANRWGNRPDPENLNRAAWERLALLREAKDQGIRVHDEEINAVIAGLDQFQQDGRFRPDYMQLVITRGLDTSVENFRSFVGEELVLERLAQIYNAGALVPDMHLKQQYAILRDQLTLEYINLTPDLVSNEVSVTEADVQAYYDENPDQFLTDEEMQVRVIKLPLSAHSNAVEITESDIEGRYLAETDQYTKEVEQIITPPMPPLNADIAARVERTTSLLGALAEINRAAQEVLLPGPAPAPRVEMVTTNMTLAEASAQIREELTQEAVIEAAIEQGEELMADLSPNRRNSDPQFDVVLSQQGLTAVTTGWFSVSARVPELGNSREVAGVAFKLEDDPYGRVSDPVATDDAVYVLYYHDHRDPFVPELADIQEDAERMTRRHLLNEKLEEKAAAWSAALQQAVKEGTTFAAAVEALELGLAIERTPPTRLYEPDNQRPNPIVQNIIRQATDYGQGQVTEPLQGFLGTVIAYVQQREVAPLSGLAEFRPQLLAQLSRQKNAVQTEEFVNFLLRPERFEENLAVTEESGDPR